MGWALRSNAACFCWRFRRRAIAIRVEGVGSVVAFGAGRIWPQPAWILSMKKEKKKRPKKKFFSDFVRLSNFHAYF